MRDVRNRFKAMVAFLLALVLALQTMPTFAQAAIIIELKDVAGDAQTKDVDGDAKTKSVAGDAKTKGVAGDAQKVTVVPQQDVKYEENTGTINEVFKSIITAAANDNSSSYESTQKDIGGLYYSKGYFIADVSGDGVQELFIRRNTVGAFDVLWYDANARKAALVGTVTYWRANLYTGKDGHSIYNADVTGSAYLGKVTLNGTKLLVEDVYDEKGGAKDSQIEKLCGSPISPSNLSDLSVLDSLVVPQGSAKPSESGNAAGDKHFPDVPADAWYSEVVSRAAGLGLINGYKDGRFGPNDSVNRGQVAVILWNMAGKPASQGSAKSFSDVHSGKYYYDAVRWASSVGVVSGYKNGLFGPDDLVTREQLAAMLANYAAKVAGKDASGSAVDYSGMKDAAKVSPWAATSVGWCFKSKIISGTKDGRVNPQGNATRAETAKMVVFLRGLL